MLQNLPWTPQRAYFIKINSAVSVVGNRFTVTLNGKLYSGIIELNKPFWRFTTDVGLNIYAIDDDNSIAVDIIGDCPIINKIKLKIGGVNVLVLPKA